MTKNFRSRSLIVHKHWYVLLLDFETSTHEFYFSIEQDLDARRLTGLECSRVEYAEGGLLSAKRQYLRMRRERLVFDVCSAPFGTTWFFSCRFSEIPVSLKAWHILVLLFILFIALSLYLSVFGWILGIVLYFLSLSAFPFIAPAVIANGGHDLDATLLKIPLIGAFYEAFFRPETYYREDTRAAYIDIVDKIVREKVDAVTAEKGVKLVEYKDATPPSHPKILSMVGSLLSLRR